MKEKVKIGLVGFGLETYWKQFAGLRERLIKYQNQIAEKLGELDITIVNAGLVDNQASAEEAVNKLSSSRIEGLVVYIATYALSSTFLPVVQQLNVPVIMLNAQPSPTIDFDRVNALGDRQKMTGEWLAYCQACSLPEFSCVLNRAGIKYHIVSGFLEDGIMWKELGEWITALKAVAGMRENRMGIMGHYYGGMLDVYSDLTLESVTFGTHVETVEMSELKSLYDNAAKDEIDRKIDEFRHFFLVSPQCGKQELEDSARVSIGLDKLVDRYGLGSLVYYYEGRGDSSYQKLITSIIAGSTLLVGKGIPVAGEYEVKNAQAMKILSLLDAGGSFSEFYLMDYGKNEILFGHDGPAHYSIAEGKVGLVPVPVFHGKPGHGLSIQMTVRHGDVTLLSVVEQNGRVKLLCAEGEAVPGPVLQIGNTNSRYKFPMDVRQFAEKWCTPGPSHHCAIGVSHCASKIKKLASLLNIEFVQV